MSLTVANQSPVELWVSAYDELPPSTWHTSQQQTLTVPARGSSSANYEYTPGTCAAICEP